MKCLLPLHLQEIFPTKLTLWLFILYITLFVNQGWLVTLSQETNNGYVYEVSFAVLFTEIIKLIGSVVIFSIKSPLCSLFKEMKTHSKVFSLYFIPASLYCIYNNLTYINLSTFDPTTYFVVLQLRVVATGLIFQLMFKKDLSFKQWTSLVLLTIGCMVKQVNLGDMAIKEDQNENAKQLNMSYSFSSLLLIAQVFCSCLAGVYNEYLLKSQSAEVSVFVQNVFHNINSVICILLLLIWQKTFFLLFVPEVYQPFMNIKVILVIVNNAAIGIVTSFFLNYLNSILKTFASALELVFTAIISRILFDIPIYLNTVISICLIFVATITYTQSPVTNSKPEKAKGSFEHV